MMRADAKGTAGPTAAKLLAAVLLTTALGVVAPAALPPHLPGAATMIFANPPCGPANDGERIDFGGSKYECGHIPMPIGPAGWDWLPRR